MAALQNIQHVSEFSPNGKLFAFINSEGKLEIWDTESNELKQVYIPNLHLNAPCTCFTWITTKVDNSDTNLPTNGQTKSKKSRKSFNESDQSLYIAFGTNKGGVVLYSYATGKIERHLKGDGHSGHVTAICLGPTNSDKLYTSGEDCRVIVWSLTKCAAIVGSSWKIGNDKPTCLVYLKKSNQLLIGARELKQWSINIDDNDDNFDGPELQQTYTGHKSNVNILKYFEVNNVEYVLSTSQMDRTISLWRIKCGQKYTNAVSTFLMEDIAYSISCSVRNDDSNRLEVAAVTRSGGVHLFIIADISKVNLAKTIKPKVTIHIASDPPDNSKQVVPIPIIAATLNTQFKEQAVLIGYGDRRILRFEQIELDTSTKNQILIRNDPMDMVLAGSKQNAVNRNKSLKTITPIIDNTVEYKTTTPQILRKSKPNEMPMETRLENLSLAHSTAHSTKNVAQLLVQGLHNRDSNILKNVFATTDEKVIRSTLQRLPPQYVSPLVTELTLLTQRKTSNVQIAVIWLKLLAQCHASQLLALGTNSLNSQFGPLIGIIEQRTYSIRQLSRLSGRLELLVSQIKRNNDDDEILYNDNMLIIEDNDSSVGSDVGIDGTNSSDDQWEEEDEDDNEENQQENDNDSDDEKMEISDIDN